MYKFKQKNHYFVNDDRYDKVLFPKYDTGLFRPFKKIWERSWASSSIRHYYEKNDHDI